MENEKKEGGNSNDYRNDLVKITIKNKPYPIHRGNQKVSAIKELGGINPNHILVEIIDGRLVDLPNDGSVTIKGGEVFNSHPPIGDNS
ncbi:MAG: multiubiquitin domain-containing protein [Bacteroidetes bacterium]|nr:multiubiquitin domain-containing protein [Bacteroidota bacterium]